MLPSAMKKNPLLNSKTTTFIFDSEDYFVANLDTGGISVGLKGCRVISIPADHKIYEEASKADNEEAAEYVFDSLMSS